MGLALWWHTEFAKRGMGKRGGVWVVMYNISVCSDFEAYSDLVWFDESRLIVNILFLVVFREALPAWTLHALSLIFMIGWGS